MALYRSPLIVTLWPSLFLKYGPMIPPAHKAHQTVSFSGCNGVSTYTCGAVLFVDVAIQPEVRFIAKQNSLMKIRNNGNLVLGPFDESTPCLMIVLMNFQTKLRINHLIAVKSVAILESNANLNFYTWKKTLFTITFKNEFGSLERYYTC
ncbi:alpha-2 adrenergic receptor [Trichonephila clavipes]|nr:alpha-2 adrenergic receptor [Trichonephila clavipes]